MRITRVRKHNSSSTVQGFRPANLVVLRIKVWYPLEARQFSSEMRLSVLLVVLDPTTSMKSAT